MMILPSQYEVYRELILSGQIDRQDVARLMQSDRAFAMWCRLKELAAKAEKIAHK